MGDLNSHMDDLQQKIDINSSIPSHLQFLQDLVLDNMTDVLAPFDPDYITSKAQHTFVSKVFNTSTRIDYQFVSSELLASLLAARTTWIDRCIFNTDHTLVRSAFITEDIFLKKASASLKQHGMGRKVLDLAAITSEQ